MLYVKKNFEVYFGIIDDLMANDRNGSYDEILNDHEGNLIEAIIDLKESLTNLIEELDDEEKEFYEGILERVNNFIEKNEIEEV